MAVRDKSMTTLGMFARVAMICIGLVLMFFLALQPMISGDPLQITFLSILINSTPLHWARDILLLGRILFSIAIIVWPLIHIIEEAMGYHGEGGLGFQLATWILVSSIIVSLIGALVHYYSAL